MGSNPLPDIAPTLVIGHKNPDTDAICSAIGYADFLRRARGARVEAAACGVMNARTAWVLEQAGITSPMRVMDVRPTAGDICNRSVGLAKAGENFMAVYRRVAEKGYRSIPVVDENKIPLGMVSSLALLKLVLPDPALGEGTRGVNSSLNSIREVLGGSIEVEAQDPDLSEDLVLTVAGSSAETFAQRTSDFSPEQTVVVVGDRPLIHETAIGRGVRALVLTGGFGLEDPALQAMAKQRGTCVIVSPHDTGSTLQLIRCSRKVEGAVEKNFVSFKASDPIDKLRSAVHECPQPLFPVIDPDDGTLLGVISKSDLVDPPLRRLVLVDHNEFSQAVDGAEQAEIIEVIDHHRLSGNLVSKEPVRFINEPVGSTCTIVARSFRDAGIDPKPGIATCLCAGIISDTLKLSSPTATRTDAELLTWLAKIAGLDIDDFARRFFEVGSVLRESSPEDAIGADRKEYEENGWKISISQIEELGLQVFDEKRASLQEGLDHLVDSSPLDFACLLVTDITLNNSMLLTSGAEEVTNAIGYPEVDKDVFLLRGVVSRKKQVFPVLSRVLAKLPR